MASLNAVHSWRVAHGDIRLQNFIMKTEGASKFVPNSVVMTESETDSDGSPMSPLQGNVMNSDALDSEEDWSSSRVNVVLVDFGYSFTSEGNVVFMEEQEELRVLLTNWMNSMQE